MFKYDRAQLEKDLKKILRAYGHYKPYGFYSLHVFKEHGYELVDGQGMVYLNYQDRPVDLDSVCTNTILGRYILNKVIKLEEMGFL